MLSSVNNPSVVDVRVEQTIKLEVWHYSTGSSAPAVLRKASLALKSLDIRAIWFETNDVLGLDNYSSCTKAVSRSISVHTHVYRKLKDQSAVDKIYLNHEIASEVKDNF